MLPAVLTRKLVPVAHFPERAVERVLEEYPKKLAKHYRPVERILFLVEALEAQRRHLAEPRVRYSTLLLPLQILDIVVEDHDECIAPVRRVVVRFLLLEIHNVGLHFRVLCRVVFRRLTDQPNFWQFEKE